jgi:hypothetical protein
LRISLRRGISSWRIALHVRLHSTDGVVQISWRITARRVPSTPSAGPASSHDVANFIADECFDRFGGRLSRRPGLLAAQVLIGQLDEHLEVALRIVAGDNPPELPGDLERFDGGERLGASHGLLRHSQESGATGCVLSGNGDTQDKRDGQRRPDR